jgi:uncharacterized protein YbaP (TraB family)
MKKLMLSALLSSIVSLVHSQLLYSITKPNVDETSYLYGTIHLGDSVLLSWDNTFLDAFYSCDVQVGEIDFINLEISPTESGMIDMMTEISKYDSLSAPQDTIQKIRELLTLEFDSASAEGILTMNPFWGLTMTEQLRSIKNANAEETIVEEKEVLNDSIYYAPIDMQLQIMADETGMEVKGLETVESQLKLVQLMSSSMTWTMFYAYLIDKDSSSKDQIDTSYDNLREIYLTQDLQRFQQIFEESEMSAEFMKLMFTQRNELMLSGMQSMMADHRKYFFAVGAGHLIDQDGLIKLLEKEGYILKAVPFSFSKMK